jgi:hypothetical protein
VSWQEHFFENQKMTATCGSVHGWSANKKVLKMWNNMAPATALFFLCQLLSNSNALPAPSFEPSASVLRTQCLRMHHLEALRGGVGSGDFRGDQSPRGDSLVKFHSDVARLTELRKTEMSQVQYISTTGSTYTVLWTKEAWDDHIHISRYWRHFTTWHLSTTAMVIWPPVIFFGVWAAALCLAKNYLKVDLSVPLAPLTLVTTALALLLTTKTNQSLIRLLEARLAWGKLVLHARVIAGILHTRLYPVNAGAALLGGRLLCTIGWSLRASLVGRGDKAIDKEEYIYIHTYTRMHTDIHKYKHQYVHTYIYVCIYLFIYVYIYVYIHTHIYIHTYICT